MRITIDNKEYILEYKKQIVENTLKQLKEIFNEDTIVANLYLKQDLVASMFFESFKFDNKDTVLYYDLCINHNGESYSYSEIFHTKIYDEVLNEKAIINYFKELVSYYN